MNRGRTPHDGGRYSNPRAPGRGRGRGRSSSFSSSRYIGASACRRQPAGADGSSSNVSSGHKDGKSHLVWRVRQESVGSISKQVGSNSPDQQDCHFPGTKDISSGVGQHKLVESSPEAVTRSSERLDGMCISASAFGKDLPSLSAESEFQESVDSISKQVGSNYSDQQDCHFPVTKDISSGVGQLKLVENSPEAVTPSSERLDGMCISASAFEKDLPSLSAESDLREENLNRWRTQGRKLPVAGVETGGSSHLDRSPALENVHMLNEPSLFVQSGTKSTPSRKGSQCEQTPHEKTAGSECSDNSDLGVNFDICPVRVGNVVSLKAPLHMQNRMKRNEAKRVVEGKNISVLKSGMLLLKSYISLKDQIEIVKRCRDLSLRPGGFYEPGYRDGGKLHLKMMCLGKNWDPETSKYGDQRPSDGARPPLIPGEFCQLVKGAIQASHSFLRDKHKVHIVEDILPSLSPNICIVNFYTKSGRLGLHQDKDESAESLNRGLPVVSFSIGDSAEFLYNNQRDITSAEKVLLESGDVLIFGGGSRHIFHGVAAILSGTAPQTLMDETNLLPGRLNLTFREY